MHQELFPQTLEHYKGLIKVVYKDNPLVEIHPWAMRASVDANCLADQSGTAYWSFVDYVHGHGDEISGTDRDVAKASAALDRIAREQGAKEKVNAATLDACLKKQDNGAVLASMKEADHLNIDGAPTLFVNGERISGALPIEQVWAVIDRALVAEGEKPPAPSRRRRRRIHPRPKRGRPPGRQPEIERANRFPRRKLLHDRCAVMLAGEFRLRLDFPQTAGEASSLCWAWWPSPRESRVANGNTGRT